MAPQVYFASTPTFSSATPLRQVKKPDFAFSIMYFGQIIWGPFCRHGPSPCWYVLPPAVIFSIFCVQSALGVPPPHSFNGMSCPRRRRSRQRSQIRCRTEDDRMWNKLFFTHIFVSVSGPFLIPFWPKSHLRCQIG